MTTDLTTLDLYRILDDADQLDKLHELQRERQMEKAITGGDRPAGMRLSIPDPVRRVKAALDPFWQIPFDDGVGARGHALEVFLEVALFHGDHAPFAGKDYTAQQPIQWHKAGRSAFDFVVQDVGGSDLVISCKTSIGSSTPSAANAAQESRMMSLAGYPAGTPFHIWTIDPSTFRAVGPYEYALDQEPIDAAKEEAYRVGLAYGYLSKLDDPTQDDAWNDPQAWQEHWGLTSTSGAFRYATLDASGAIEARNRAFIRARSRAAAAKHDEDAAKKLLRPHVEEQLELARRDDPNVKSVVAYSGDTVVTYTIDARGALRVTEKALEATDAAA